ADPVPAKVGGLVRPGPAGDIVIQAMIEIMIEWLARLAAVAGEIRGAPFIARLKAADAAAITADAAGEMRELDLQRRQFVEQAGIDEADRRRHQRKFPAEHATEIVRIHARPANDARQRMDEDVKTKIGAGFPERPQLLGIEWQVLQFRGDDGAGKAELDSATL